MESIDVQAAARALLARSLGTDGVRVVAEESDRVAGGAVHRYWGAAEGRPNEVHQVVVGDDGEEAALAELEGAAGRALFTPEVTAAARVALERSSPVIVDPASNDLVLRECARLDERVTVTIPVSGVKPKADVYLLADTTGSMSPALTAVQAGIDSILTALDPTVFDVAFGVGNYRDFPVEGSGGYAFQHQLAPGTDTVSVRNAVLTWSAVGGGDGSEAQLFALENIAKDPATGWRPDARRIIAWFGDAPGHDPVCAAISGAGADVTEGTATDALRAAGVTVVAVSTITGFYPAGLDDDPVRDAGDYTVCTIGGTSGQATRITGATGGTHVIGAAADILATLIALIKDAVTVTGNVRLVPSASIAGFVAGIAPAGGYGPLRGDTEHHLAFDVSWTGTVECAEDPQVFSGSLDVVADGAVVGGKPVRITVPACEYHHVVEVLCGTRKPVGERECSTVAAGRYATAVTIYNPGPCPVLVEKRFAPVLLNGKPVGREPKTVEAKPFARIRLQPGEATMDDCCALGEAVRLDHATPTLGVLDLVSDRPLVVTGVYTAGGVKEQTGVPAVHTRAVEPRRA
ncbi:vWA domain-containing protein [Spongiactinospora sp. TRM90649]|uniref:vWA domain-containing protein n=1 Tax=Spongiactinospora sp. TRM90649 TaxID=3031114 RepID=UPI0023F6903B|nr:vWA domain-containing protein [Spongiactinospora sp. TRM90649]MDF5758340.1 VWA domain-containing protein [Spongiactinospora sp. TRM90649]